MTHSALPAPQSGSQASSGLPTAAYPPASYPSLSSAPAYWTAQQALPAYPAEPQPTAQPQYATPQYAAPQYATPQYASADTPTQQYSGSQATTLQYAATAAPAPVAHAAQPYQGLPYQGLPYEGQPYEGQPYEGQAYDYRQDFSAGPQEVLGGDVGRRPVALTAALGAGLLASVLVVVSQVLGLMGGRATLQAWRVDQLPAGTDTFTPEMVARLNDAFGQLQLRGYVSIGLAVVMAVMIILSRRGALVARSFAVVFMGLTAVLTVASIWDVFPGVAKAVGGGALGLLPVITVLLFAPAVSRYRSLHRPAQRTAA